MQLLFQEPQQWKRFLRVKETGVCVIRSKIFYKAMLIVGGVILTYTLSLLLIVLPIAENSTQALEEKNGKEVLNKVVLLTNNMQTDLEDFQEYALQSHKEGLKNLTNTFWSLVQAKYEQSHSDNIGSVLEERGGALEKNLAAFYAANKDVMNPEELKQAIINYVNIFRYDDGSGYFFIHKQTTVVAHPIHPEFRGKDFSHIKDPNGVSFVLDFQKVCEQNGSGLVRYQWEHAQTKEIGDKIAYVFTFEPFGWIIGTTASIGDLQERLKEEVILLANKIRFGHNNYFFINGYDHKVIAHPYLEKGTDFSNRKDSHGKLFVPAMVKMARENGEGFTRYWWTKDPSLEGTFEKLTFSKDFPDWEMVINTGIYIDGIQREVEKRKTVLIAQLRGIMQKTRIGKSGYMFIVDHQAVMVIHPNTYMQGKYTGDMKNPVTGNNIFDDTKNAAHSGQPMYAKWDRPSDKGHYIYDKIFWAEYIPKLQWYIVASAYTSELQETSRQFERAILWLGMTMLLLASLASFIFFRKLLKPISTLSVLAARVTRGDYTARSQCTNSDEVGVLSREFNTMVDTIKDNIYNLDQKVAEKTKEIEAHNKVFETLFYESSDGILLLRDGHFIDCNRAAYRMLCYDEKEELLALPFSDISPEKQDDGSSSMVRINGLISLALDKGSSRFEWIHLCKDGSETHLEVVLTRIVVQDNAIIHVVWRDINEKKAAERRLKNALAEFGAIMDSIDYGVLFMDDKLKTRIVNQAFRDMWQVPEGFVDGGPSMRELMAFNRYNDLYLVADNDFEDYLDEREADVRKGAIPAMLIERKDGMILQYQCVVLPDGWRMLTYFDITELKKTQDKLARAQKMEALGIMAGGVAHDLNNILGGIVTYPEMLLSQLPEDSELRGPLETIQESGERAAMVVADLLTVARGAASIREPHDINVLIDEYLHSPEHEKLQALYADVHCVAHLEASQPIISCSPVHIKKMFMNLITNAVEAIETNGAVHIYTTNLKVDENGNGRHTVPEGQYVVFTVLDNGPGIAPDDVAHVFEPFYSKKVMGRSGTGLGLTVVWNSVEDHDGHIRVESSDSGSCFTLYFPICTEPLKPSGKKQDTHPGRVAGEHILIVDDEEQLREIGSMILEGLGYTTSTASSGEEAIEFIRSNPVDLLVIDMLMAPGMNGRETYEEILKIYPEQRAIIASGFSESDDVTATLKLGARGLIKKPYLIDQLSQAVADALKN